MSDTNPSPSILVISDDTQMVDALISSNRSDQELRARDTVQSVLDQPELLADNSIVIFDIGTDKNDLDAAINQVLRIKEADPTQVLILAGEHDMLGEILKTAIQPMVFRAFTKPISPNQVSLAFRSGNVIHAELVAKQAAGEDITVVGPIENRTNVASLASERSNNSAIYAAIAVVALGIIGWFVFSGSQDAPEIAATPAPTIDQEVALEPEGVVSVSAAEQRISELNELASNAMLGERLIAPKGDNALEYYDQVLAIDAYDTNAYQGKKAIANRLRGSYNELVSNAEFDRALKVINVLNRIEPLNVENDALRGGLEKAIDVHVKNIQANGTAEQVAQTSAVLKKIESEFEGSKSASDALRLEGELIVKIDAALDGNKLIPPEKNNAYALVSEALKANSVSKANITPRVKALSAKLLRLGDASLQADNFEESSKLAALIKRLNVDPAGLAALTNGIAEKQAQLKAAAEELAATDTATEPAVEEPAGPKIIPAKIISRSAPRYPKRALNQNIEGWVDVAFYVSPEGTPVQMRVKESTPAGIFDRAALKAVTKWTFSPARDEETGEAVLSEELSSKLQFKLQ